MTRAESTQKSISNALIMFKSLRGKEVTNKEFIKHCREFKVRDGLLKYCVERGLCTRRNKVYFFPHNLELTPRIVKFILDDRASYLKDCYAKRKFDKKAKEQKTKSKESERKALVLKQESQKKEVETTSRNTADLPTELQSLIDKNRLATETLIDAIHRNKEQEVVKFENWVASLQRELKQLDKTCLSYLDEIELLEERVAELEKQKEEMREVFFQVGMETIQQLNNKTTSVNKSVDN